MIRQQLVEATAKAVKEAFPDVEVAPEVVYAQPGHGDFATNVAFQLATHIKKAPTEVATQLVSKIEHPYLESAEVAGGGYINFSIKSSYFIQQLTEINPKFGQLTAKDPQKIQVEFISANPTGPLTLANARGGFVGDILSNILSKAGHNITREYYVNDAGTQVAKLADSMKAEAGLPIEGERQYVGEYVAELAKLVDPTKITDEDELRAKAVAQCLAWIKESAERLGISFDQWTSEKSLTDGSGTKNMLDWLRSHNHLFEQDGATWLRSTAYGDERDRVLVRSDGQPTYLLGDLAYHYDILVERGFDRAIKVWGADHAGQVASLRLTAEQFKAGAKIDFALLQFVRLLREGQEVKMSKRAGTYVTIDELMDTLEAAVGKDAAVGVARWFFLSRSADQRIDFDLGLAADESAKNPYFYVMYAYARAHSLLSRAKTEGLGVADAITDLNDQERELVRQMSRLPEMVEHIAANYGVHHLTFYAYELARLFQDWYERERIMGLEPEIAAQKLYFAQQFTVFMDVIWGLLGIKPQQRLESAKD